MSGRGSGTGGIAGEAPGASTANATSYSSRWRDSGGVRLLSWRVLLLPYLGHGDLYRRFHLDEPWDSPHNKMLLPEMPEVYAPPEATDAEAEPFATFCQVPVGPATAFAGQFGMPLPTDFRGQVAPTVLLFEAPEAVWWTRPGRYISAVGQARLSFRLRMLTNLKKRQAVAMDSCSKLIPMAPASP